MTAQRNDLHISAAMLPIWCVRSLFLLLDIALYGLVIAAAAVAASKGSDFYTNYNISKGTALGIIIGISVAGLLTCVVLLVMDVMCIVRRLRHTLTAKFFFTASLIQLIVALVGFVLAMIGPKTWFYVVLRIFITVFYCGIFFYSWQVLKRSKQSQAANTGFTAYNTYNGYRGAPGATSDDPEAHKLVDNPDHTAYAMAPTYDETSYKGNTAYGSQAAQNMPYDPPAAHAQPTAYNPQMATQPYDPIAPGAPSPQGYPARPSEMAHGGQTPPQPLYAAPPH